MGYTPRVLETVGQMVKSIADMQDSQRINGGWVPLARITDMVRTTEKLSRAGVNKRLAAALNLGLIERQVTPPDHVDQRIAYYRVTEYGRKIIHTGQDTGIRAALDNLPGQLHFTEPTDTGRE